jgi:hypothetical protein
MHLRSPALRLKQRTAEAQRRVIRERVDAHRPAGRAVSIEQRAVPRAAAYL